MENGENIEAQDEFGFKPKLTVIDFVNSMEVAQRGAFKVQLKLIVAASRNYDNINDIYKLDYAKYLKLQTAFNKKYEIPTDAGFLGNE